MAHLGLIKSCYFSHKIFQSAQLHAIWLGLLFNLVQLNNFWTPNTLIYAKWQYLKYGYFDLFQGQQLSYIVYDY
jgi:hypothetical protein